MEAGYENVSMLSQYDDQTICNNEDEIDCSSEDDANRITQNINGSVGTNLHDESIVSDHLGTAECQTK